MPLLGDVGSSRKLLHDQSARFAAHDELPFEDSRQFLREKSSPAVDSPFLQTDHMSMSERSALDSPWQDDDQLDIVNNTLAAESDMPVLEAGPPQEAVTGTSHEGVDAATDISKFPRKNDL